MRNIVVVGGTDGMGRALATHYLGTGDSVLVVGRNLAKGEEFLKEAARGGAESRGFFLQADLSTVAGQRRAADEIASRFPVIDALVLAAQNFRSRRAVTAEGFEYTFALYYLARYVLSNALVPQLEQARRPIVLNICGPGVSAGEIHWDDLQFERNYKGLKAMMQGSRANDLLGIGFVQAHRGSKVRYVLYNPVFVATSFSGEYNKVARLFVSVARRFAPSVEKGVAPIIELLDDPPAREISAYKKRKEIDLGHKSFNAEDASRLHRVTEELLAGTYTS